MAEMRKDAAEGGKGQVRNLRTTLVARDGQQIPILINAALLRNDQGVPTGSVGIFTDLRQIKAIEQNARPPWRRWPARRRTISINR